uniref:Uncharacterized protein n=1 Tax=Oryza sativa subsp. japonica TaxID=39947 RepID=Q10P55_ORYSJ|nr:hypothetical protein LOC_Os03g14240 [Oryza sativa Japonica Group]
MARGSNWHRGILLQGESKATLHRQGRIYRVTGVFEEKGIEEIGKIRKTR